jgi:predicted nuclease of predicted toxin-antitoxin system
VLALYVDQHVSRAIVTELRRRGVDVLTAYEDGASELPDPALLDRASELKRVLLSRDDDLLVEANKRLREGCPFGASFTHINCAPPSACASAIWNSSRR